MSTRIEHLTLRQTSLLQQYRDRWSSIRLATSPVDRAAAEAGVHLAYANAGLDPPVRIVWCGGPIELARSWDDVRRSSAIGASVRAAIGERMRNRSIAAIRGSLGPAVWTRVFGGVRSTTADAVSAAVSQAVLRGARGQRPRVATRLARVLTALMQLRSPNRSWPSFERSGLGQDDLDWLGPYEFLHDVLGLEQETGFLRGLWRLAANAGWVLPHEHVCWLSERPHTLQFDARGRLHSATGPALAYQDGWKVHAWKGVEVPADIIEDAESVTISRIDREADAFVRRCMIEIMTPQRFLANGGASFVTQDETGILWRKTWWNGDTWAAVEVVNGTPEPDGTRRHYVLQVPPEMPTAMSAVAWTYGMSERQYANLLLRT